MTTETIYVIIRTHFIDGIGYDDPIEAHRNEQEAIDLCEQWNKEAKDNPDTDEEYYYAEVELT
jgi:hypothetical protein